jgi:hypothetical protein
MIRYSLALAFLPPHERRMLQRAAEHEAAELEARALGIEAEAKALWHERSAESMRTTYPPPTLRDCVREILYREAGWR